VQYRQALPSRNAGLKEDSPQKNRKINAVAPYRGRRWKHRFLLRAVLKNGGIFREK